MLPFDTELHWFTISDVIEHINKNSGLLKNVSKGIVHTVLEYDSKLVVAKYKLTLGKNENKTHKIISLIRVS